MPEPDLALEAALAEVDRALSEALEEIGSLQAARQARGDELATLRRAEAARVAEQEAARRRLADAERRSVEERALADAARLDRETLETVHVAATEAAVAARATEREAVDRREAARSAADEADGASRAAAEAATSAGSRVAALRGSVQALRQRAADEEARGIARAARRVGGQRLDEDLQVDPGLRAAVEAALGEAARAYLVGRDAVVGLAGERGMVVVDAAVTVPVGRDPAFHGRLVELGGGILADAVRRDRAGGARRILERAAWVPDVGALVELQAVLPDGWIVVSRDGQAVAGQVAIALGRGDGTLERRAELERLETELSALEADAGERQTAAEAALAAAATARERLDATRADEAASAAARRAADEAERAAGRAAEGAAREAGWAAAQADRLEAEAVRAREALESLDLGPRAVADGADADGAALDDLSAAATWQARATDLRARRDRLGAQQAAVDGARRDAQAVVARALAAATYDEQRIARAEADERALAEREASALADRDRLSVEVAAAQSREASARDVLDELRAADSADRDRLLAAEAAASAARERLRAADERVRAAEVAELEARLGLDAIREQVLVELAGIGSVGVRALQAAVGAPSESSPRAAATRPIVAAAPGDSTAGDLDDDVEAAQLEAILPHVLPAWEAAPPATDPPAPGRLAALRRRYHELGAANPFAVDEYAELKNRVQGLETQGADLRDAIARTRTLIDELTTMITVQFQATFRALEAAFDTRFKQLFGGGFARLELTDPDDLATTGVEIVARPPGKKAQALAMLSGGERSLTAVALLFAMLEVRPVPFCVLDEVDAALDEANVGRFSDALRGLAGTTQFIVITHNRGTIEAADALYGVTVGDDSVSRVISLRLDEATAIAAKSAGNGAGALDPVAS